LEETVPPGVNFSSPDTEEDSVGLGNIPAGSFKSIWVKRVTPAGTPATAGNEYKLRFSFSSDLL